MYRLTRTVRRGPINHYTHRQHRFRHTIHALQAEFRDPNSPYHIPPGTQGPESPDDVPPEPRQEAEAKLLSAGFLPETFWEQAIVWGDHDSFQHVNNVRYVRFFESSRIHWMYHLGRTLGGKEEAQRMLRGQGISLILKSIEVRFKRPVTYPDTLLIAHKPHRSSAESHKQIDLSEVHLKASAYSLAQRAFVAHSNEVVVWYDYDKLRKCIPEDRLRNVLWSQYDS